MTTSDQATPPEARPTILVIDDERGPRESLRFLLKDDYRVLCADTVARGLELLRENPPDTVIMDIRMPGLNGIDGLRKIRERDTDLAVIMLTGFAAVGTAQEAIRSDANDYVEKPFDAAEMRRVVRHHVEQTRLRRKRAKLLSGAEALERCIGELQEKERLAELGQVSAEFVHDLRNTLMVTSGYSSLLRLEMEEAQRHQADAPAEVGQYLDTLETSMRQCVEMLDAWQRLIRKGSQPQTRFHVHALVHDCVKTCRPEAEAMHAHVACETPGDDVDLIGDRVQILRALTNLVHNAVHALPPENGLVGVRAEVRGASVRLSVTDNGCGIPPENLQRIFSPDFSTRRAAGGTGLGLFIAQKIVQAHGGEITVESAVGRGTTFSILLTRAAPLTGGAVV